MLIIKGTFSHKDRVNIFQALKREFIKVW